MSASLVGSEMCIRDRFCPVGPTGAARSSGCRRLPYASMTGKWRFRATPSLVYSCHFCTGMSRMRHAS
eukprot:15298081-Alexandrium_andersonii.AAC.1